MRRFLKANQEKTSKSNKEQVVSTSYCGGMFDIITIVRSALGRWAVEQLLIELEKWYRTEGSAEAV